MFGINSQLLECLCNHPTIDLKTVTEWYWKGVFRRKSIIYRKDYHILFFEHIGPLSRVVLVLETTVADKGTSVKMEDDFFDSVLEILLGSGLNDPLLLGRLAARDAAFVTFV